MTKKYKKETVTKTVNRLVKIVCELCGREAKNGDWSPDKYGVEEVTIKYRDGSIYPEGGSGTDYEVDICPVCFDDRLIPWLKSQGANVEEHQWDI